jgi:hypothetical protein
MDALVSEAGEEGQNITANTQGLVEIYKQMGFSDKVAKKLANG